MPFDAEPVTVKLSVMGIRTGSGRPVAIEAYDSVGGASVLVDVSRLDPGGIPDSGLVSVTGRFESVPYSELEDLGSIGKSFRLGMAATSVSPAASEVEMPVVSTSDLRQRPDGMLGDSSVVVSIDSAGLRSAADAVRGGTVAPVRPAMASIAYEGFNVAEDPSGGTLVYAQGRSSNGSSVRVEFPGLPEVAGPALEAMARLNGGRIDVEGVWRFAPGGAGARYGESDWRRESFVPASATMIATRLNGRGLDGLSGRDAGSRAPLAERIARGDPATALSYFKDAIVVPEFGLRDRVAVGDFGPGKTVHVYADPIYTGRHVSGRSAVEMLSRLAARSEGGFTFDVPVDLDRAAGVVRERSRERGAPQRRRSDLGNGL